MLFFCLNFILFSWCFMVLVCRSNVINVVVDFHFIFITVRWGKKEEAQGQKRVGLRVHSKSLKGPGSRLPHNAIYPVASLAFAFGISSTVLLLFSKYRFFHSPTDPVFAYISYHWKLGLVFCFFFFKYYSFAPGFRSLLPSGPSAKHCR